MIRLLPLAVIPFLMLAAATRAEEKIAIRTLGLRADEMPEVFVRTGKDYMPLPFSSVQPGETVMALATDPLTLHRSETGPDGKVGYPIAHRVKLPQQAAGILLLGWKNGDGARYVAIRDEFANARYNDWLLINASVHPVAFKSGNTGRPVPLKPGAAITHRIQAGKNEGVEIVAQAPLKGKIRTFYSTFWPVRADRRSVVVFVDDGEKIAVKNISDPLAPAVADKKAD